MFKVMNISKLGWIIELEGYKLEYGAVKVTRDLPAS